MSSNVAVAAETTPMVPMFGTWLGGADPVMTAVPAGTFPSVKAPSGPLTARLMPLALTAPPTIGCLVAASVSLPTTVPESSVK